MEQFLEMSGMDRLRWLVCREFGVLPTGDTPSEADCLWCGVNMLLDRKGGDGFVRSAGFDPDRFEALKGGGA